MIIIGLFLVVLLFWAIKSGQFDDLEGDAHRILMDDDLIPEKKKLSTLTHTDKCSLGD
jgi:cbb3-type cytochrome oxidase maturation protein